MESGDAEWRFAGNVVAALYRDLLLDPRSATNFAREVLSNVSIEGILVQVEQDNIAFTLNLRGRCATDAGRTGTATYRVPRPLPPELLTSEVAERHVRTFIIELVEDMQSSTDMHLSWD